MNLNDWIKDAANIQAYRKWIEDPVTQAMIQGLKDEARPRNLPILNGEAALLLHGEHLGSWRIINRMETLDTKVEVPAELVSLYGMEQALVDQGYTPERAKQLAEEMRNGE